MDFNKILSSPEYSFLKENERLGKNISILCLGGSLAYGTNLPGKGDVDIRGMFLEKPDEIIGIRPNPEQVVHKQTDTVIYSFNKLLGLLINCNPNTIEMLGCKPEHYFYLNDIGRQMVDNRKMFLSQRCVSSFAGYANQQLNRLENALARDRLDEARKIEHVKNSMENSLRSFESQYNLCDYGSAFLYTDDIPDGGREIFVDMNFTRFPVQDFSSLMNVLTNVYRSYNKINHRNHKKDEEHLDKHAMHLLRLYFMAIDILEKQEIVTYREDERELLLSVRKGRFRLADGTYSDDFFDLRNEMEKRFMYAKEHTELPLEPDFTRVNDFKVEVNRQIILST